MGNLTPNRSRNLHFCSARYALRDSCKLFDRRLPRDLTRDDVEPGLSSSRDHADAHDRVTAEFEEVVSHPHGFDAEYVAHPQHGMLETGLAEQIERFDLNLSAMKDCVLRQYQEFGAKFILVRGHAFLGDEMIINMRILKFSRSFCKDS